MAAMMVAGASALTSCLLGTMAKVGEPAASHFTNNRNPYVRLRGCNNSRKSAGIDSCLLASDVVYGNVRKCKAATFRNGSQTSMCVCIAGTIIAVAPASTDACRPTGEPETNITKCKASRFTNSCSSHVCLHGCNNSRKGTSVNSSLLTSGEVAHNVP